MEIEPSVRVYVLPTYKVTILGSQEKHGSHKLLRNTRSFDALLADYPLLRLWREALPFDLCDHSSIRNAIDIDIPVAHFFCETSRETNDPGLRCHIVKIERSSHIPRRRGCVDDFALFLVLHVGNDSLTAEPHAP